MRRSLALAVKIAISGALLYLVFARVDLNAIGARLQQAKISWLIALVLVITVQLVLVGLRWHRIGRQCSAPFTVTNALRYMFIGSFFNQTLPSTVGGDAARIWFVSRAGAGWKAATYSVIVDRILGLSVLIAMVVVCMYWLLDLVRDPLGRASVILVNGAGIVATIAFLTLGRVHWRWLDRWFVTRHIAAAAAVAFKVMSSPRSAGLIVGLSVAVHLLTIAAIWCAARSVAAPLEFWQALLLVPPVVLVATIPISIAGWGVRESAMMTVFAYAGLLDADGLIVSILYGAGLFAVGAAGGLIWILSSEQPIAPESKPAREA